jgi:hypothetical protein
VLDGDYDSTAVTDFGLSGECEVHARRKRDDGRKRWLGWRLVFVVTEGTGVEDTVCAMIVLNCGVSHIDSGLRSPSCQLFRVLIDIVEIILEQVSYPCKR